MGSHTNEGIDDGEEDEIGLPLYTYAYRVAYAIDGEDVVFGHMDEVPGATLGRSREGREPPPAAREGSARERRRRRLSQEGEAVRRRRLAAV